MSNQIKIIAAVNAAVNDQEECQYVTERFETVSWLLSRQTRWLVLAQFHPSVETIEWFKKIAAQFAHPNGLTMYNLGNFLPERIRIQRVIFQYSGSVHRMFHCPHNGIVSK